MSVSNSKESDEYDIWVFALWCIGLFVGMCMRYYFILLIGIK